MKQIKPKMGAPLLSRGLSGIGQIYVARSLPNPTLTTILAFHSSEDIADCVITSILGTAVT